jgi:hypothetical protein
MTLTIMLSAYDGHPPNNSSSPVAGREVVTSRDADAGRTPVARAGFWVWPPKTYKNVLIDNIHDGNVLLDVLESCGSLRPFRRLLEKAGCFSEISGGPRLASVLHKAPSPPSEFE